MSKLDKLVKLKEDYVKEMKKEGKAALNDAFKEFFTEFPEVQGIRWTQYAPHFNDGDACVFSLHGMYATFDKTRVAEELGEDFDEADQEPLVEGSYQDYEGWHDITYLGEEDKKSIGPARFKALKAAGKLYKKLGEIQDTLETVLGGDVKVIATAKKLHVDEYDHD